MGLDCDGQYASAHPDRQILSFIYPRDIPDATLLIKVLVVFFTDVLLLGFVFGPKVFFSVVYDHASLMEYKTQCIQQMVAAQSGTSSLGASTLKTKQSFRSGANKSKKSVLDSTRRVSSAISTKSVGETGDTSDVAAESATPPPATSKAWSSKVTPEDGEADSIRDARRTSEIQDALNGPQ